MIPLGVACLIVGPWLIGTPYCYWFALGFFAIAAIDVAAQRVYRNEERLSAQRRAETYRAVTEFSDQVHRESARGVDDIEAYLAEDRRRREAWRRQHPSNQPPDNGGTPQ